MSRWFEHPTTSQTLEGDQVLNVLSFINEAKNSFKTLYVDPNANTSPLDKILKLWREKSSVEKEWLSRVLDNGPMADKIESMGTVITEFPMYSLYYLDHLISLVNLSKKRFAIISSDLLTKLFTNFLLPKMRPLINLKDRPLNTLSIGEIKKDKNGIPIRDKILTMWYFEEQLKTRYVRFLKALEDLVKNESDPINKVKIINLLYKLCTLKENQSLILDILVNKLGDKNKKVAGSAFSKLSDIATLHHILMAKIVRSIRKFIFRPNLSKKAQYYAVQLLARCKINKYNMKAEPNNENDIEDISEIVTDNVAVELVQIYIGVFKRLVDSTKSKCEKLYTAIMTGLSRALQFTDGVDKNIQKHINSVFKLVHSSNLNLSIQCLKVLYVIVFPKSNKTRKETPPDDDKNVDHFFRLVYRTILNPSIFFNSQKVGLIDIFFKSIASDSDSTRVKAMIKRMLQMCLHHPEPGFICVCLLFLSRLTNSKHKSIFNRKSLQISTNPSEKNQLKLPIINENAVVESDSDGEEIIADVISDNEDGKEENIVEKTGIIDTKTSWFHYNNRQTSNQFPAEFYDPFSRNPKYANADKEPLVELDFLSKHYHPSVRIFVEKIQNMEKIVYKTDPTEDMSLAKFLDRFAYKNPKKVDDKRKHLQKPMVNVTDEIRQIPVNRKEFANLNEENVPTDELFFYKYFNYARENNLSRENEEIDSEFSDSDTEFDKYLMRENEDGDNDEYNMSGSEFGDDLEMDDEFSDFTDDDEEEEEDQLDKMECEEEQEVEEDEGDQLDKMGDEDEEEEQDSDDDDEETETIHSSKRKRLGPELSNITTGALSLGKTFENIKEKAANQIRTDRKKRKEQKNKVSNRNFNPKFKVGKRKFKK